MKRTLSWLFVASSVAALFGVWNLGEQIADHAIVHGDSWQFSMLDRFDLLSRRDFAASVLRGLAFFVPILLTALVVSRAWAQLVAHGRRRPLDAGWWLAPWLFALLVPSTLPLGYVALGLSFGLVFGCHAFGGTGRYIVNPALLGVVFLSVAYPELCGNDRWLPGANVLSTWASVSAGAAEGAAATSSAWKHFLGHEIGAIGTASSLACLLGGAVLVALRRAAFGIIAGGVVGVLLAGGVGAMPVYEQLALGQFAFLLAFVATDPSTRPVTTAGEWAYGLSFGLLVVALRTGNPDHPEGSISALLLASLCVPLFDAMAQRARHALTTLKGTTHG